MGMFDYIRSSYNLGEHFTNVEMQTKGLACAMCRYWISPDGCLYELTYRETHDFVEIGVDDERYDPKRGFLNYEWIPTGIAGAGGAVDLLPGALAHRDQCAAR